MAEDAVSTCLLLKFRSMLQEAEEDRSSPSPIISRFRSISENNPKIIVNLLYDLIDALSECRIHGWRRKSRASRKGIFGVFTVSPLSDFLFIRSMRIRLDDIEKKLSTYKVPDEPIPSSEIQQAYPDTDESRIIGFESLAKRIEDLLFDTVNGEREGLTSIGILGRPGCGKSALSQKVFASPRIQENFSPRIWVCLSDGDMQSFNDSINSELNGTTSTSSVRALNNILEQIGYHETELETALTMIKLWKKFVEILQCGLMGKRYLIVLDDALQMDFWLYDWLPGGSGGGVIVTSRSEHIVRRLVEDKHVIRMDSPLSDDACWEIFRDHVVLQQTGETEMLEKMREDIIRNCDGRPLAARSLAYIISPLLAHDISKTQKT